MSENYAGDCIDLEDHQPIILLGIVDTLALFRDLFRELA